MPQNVILLVIDSMGYDYIFNRGPNVCPAPFLTSLRQKSVFAEKMYSMAPYTEAAVMALLAGVDTMDYGGYMKRFCDIPETVLETAQKAGVQIYQVIQPHIYPSSLQRGISNSFVNVTFDFNALWSYRLKYYSILFKKGELTEADYLLLEELLTENLDSWLSHFKQILEGAPAISLIADNIKNFEIESYFKILFEQQQQFEFNKRHYINDLLHKETTHVLFSIKTVTQEHKIHKRELKHTILKQNQKTIKRIFKLNGRHLRQMLKEAIFIYTKFFLNFLRTFNLTYVRKCFRHVRYMINRLYQVELKQRFGEDYDAFKNAPSVHKHFEHFLSWHDSCRSDKEPYLAYIHVDDIHNPEIFFSYDSEDPDQLAHEFRRMDDYMDSLPANYNGSITYDLALRYIDDKLRNFVEQLNQRNMLKDTAIIITSDHGFSFFDQPLRDAAPNNYYEESYHVPFFLISQHIPSKIISSLLSTQDIPATILDMFCIKCPDFYKGKSILRGEYRDCVRMEYMGGGCPDMSRRKIIYGASNGRYKIWCSADLKNSISIQNIEGLFDLQKDPHERINLAQREKLKQRKEIKLLLQLICQRHKQLQECESLGH